MTTNNPSIALSIDDIRPKLDFDNKTACAYLGVSPKVLARLRELGEVRATKVGAFWRYKREWLDAYLESVTIGRSEYCRLSSAVGGRPRQHHDARRRPMTQSISRTSSRGAQ